MEQRPAGGRRLQHVTGCLLQSCNTLLYAAPENQDGSRESGAPKVPDVNSECRLGVVVC